MAIPDISQLPTSRQFAIEHGHMYYVGSICRRNHDGVRYSKTNHCVKCTLFRISTKEMVEYKKQYRQSKQGKDVANLYNKLYYQKNREKEIVRATRYAHQNPDIVKKIKEKRSRVQGKHTLEDRERLLRVQKYKCNNCKCCIKERSSRHLDHIMPISKGGSNNADNLQWLCKQCNMSKKDKHPIDWAQQNGRLL